MTPVQSSLRAPRSAMAFVIALLIACAGAIAAPDASGQPSPDASPSGSASPSPAGDTLAVTLLNPSAAYDDPPKVSDRFDGVDTRYTIVARTAGTAQSAILEASIAPQNSDGSFGNDILIGELTRVSPVSDVWQYDWDIPTSLAEGTALITVRAYVDTPAGFVETGGDAQEVELFFKDSSPQPIGAWETVDISWPEQEGALGWYKPRVGAWRTLIDGSTSPGATHVQLFVSTTPPGESPAYVACGSGPVALQGGIPRFSARCTLDALTLPSAVTTIAVVADYRPQNTNERFPQAADVRTVASYTVSPEDMSVRLNPIARRVVAPATACQAFTVFVTDDHDRLVLGANVDVHATGPTDELILAGTQMFVPDSAHATERTSPCPGSEDVEPPVNPLPPTTRNQGEHNVPGGLDVKHMENRNGTGLDGMNQAAGVAAFLLASENPGRTEVTAWVDDEEIARETDQRPLDNDRLDPGEPTGTALMQWLPSAPTLSLDPLGGTVPAAECFPFVVKARAGTHALPQINVDVHATGPDGELDFCNPAGGSERRAPAPGAGANAHTVEDDHESHHTSTTAPPAQHTEGETDAAGNFVVGLTSPSAGDSSVVAWIDGEPGADDDVQGGAETSTSGTVSWATSSAEADLGFVNPSPYGGTTEGSGTGLQMPDDGGVAEILVRVDLPDSAPGVEIMLSRDNRRTFSTLGEAERVRGTDLYRFEWTVDLPDGLYALRARIEGTTIVEDVNVTVGAGERLPMVPNPSFETLELRKPEVAAGAPFTRRATTVAGRASAGAEGVDVYYTKVPAKDTPRLQDWIFCGYADLDGTGTARQEFTTTCTLTGADQAGQVTGIAAITYDCTVDGCDADPFPEPPAEGAPVVREQGQKDTGQALRVFGYEAHPLLALEPAETQAVTGECRRFEVVLRDQTGQPIADGDADVHLDGAAPAHFCRPADAPAGIHAPDAGGHTADGDLEAGHADGSPGMHAEGRTLPNGKLIFGVTSEAAGDVQLTAWLDRNGDDLLDADDLSDTSVVHWVEPAGGCSVTGSEGPDVLRGTAGADVICALEGNDVIRARGGDDVVFAGEGADRIFGAGGRDTIRGGRGSGLVNGGRGRDTCRGGPGRDRVVRCEGRAVAARRSGV